MDRLIERAKPRNPDKTAQTYRSPVRIDKYPFELVKAAYQILSHICPHVPVFVSSEITHELHSPDGAEEVTERKGQLNIDATYLAKKVAGIDYAYFSQKRSVDHRKRTLLIEAANISFSNCIAVKDNCCYYVSLGAIDYKSMQVLFRVHQEDAERTCFKQTASMHVVSLFGFKSTAEKTALKHYSASMVGSEITQELHSPTVAVEVTERKCQPNIDAPYLPKKVAGIDDGYFSQKTSLDRRKQTLLIEAANISFNNRTAVKENCYTTPEVLGIDKLIKSGTAYTPPFQEPIEAPSASATDSAIDASENDNEDDASTSEAAALANADVEHDGQTSSSQATTADARVEASRRGPEELHVGGLRTGTARIGRAPRPPFEVCTACLLRGPP